MIYCVDPTVTGKAKRGKSMVFDLKVTFNKLVAFDCNLVRDEECVRRGCERVNYVYCVVCCVVSS